MDDERTDTEPADEDDPARGTTRFVLRTHLDGLGAEELSLDALLEHTTDAIVLLDREDVVRYWNHGAEVLFQYARDDVLGRRAGFILPEDLLADDELGWIRRRLEAGQGLENHVTRRVRRDGTELVVSLTRTVVRDRAGRHVGSTAVLRDITAQRRNDEELVNARALAMMGELASKLAHEVKNPLAGIYAAVQLLGREFAADDPRREVFDNVAREVHRVDETVQELLSFARPTPPRPQPTDVASFVRDSLESLRVHPALEPHAFALDVEEELVVQADARLLGQVLANLVLNAGQAMEEPGTVTIHGRRDGHQARVTVSDTGPGIRAEQRESVFEAFFTTRSRGSGLGLCIARKNVEAHGGRLVLLERAEPGAAFEFTLPLAPGPAARAE